jgi:hypothetical protein
MLDFSRVRSKEVTVADIAKDLTVADLHRLTDEMVDTERSLIADTVDADVTFVPVDREANDRFAARPEDVNLAWTLGHVIVHTTASAEEAAALATELARSLEIKGRSRYEVPWQTVHTVEEIVHRLEESRSMRHGFLNAWPDQPNTTLTYTATYQGATPVNSIGRFVQGLMHGESHLEQIKKIVSQARAARGA